MGDDDCNVLSYSLLVKYSKGGQKTILLEQSLLCCTRFYPIFVLVIIERDIKGRDETSMQRKEEEGSRFSNHGWWTFEENGLS
jgi:hypothetical protein